MKQSTKQSIKQSNICLCVVVVGLCFCCVLLLWLFAFVPMFFDLAAPNPQGVSAIASVSRILIIMLKGYVRDRCEGFGTLQLRRSTMVKSMGIAPRGEFLYSPSHAPATPHLPRSLRTVLRTGVGRCPRGYRHHRSARRCLS